ncbi:hypothetical protein V1264_008044 [Littorina saxatilis]|uniref:Uncharacterized protein n=1 Tax=Littorina saxatilis TaxID=31220 RepID=A0AAN9G1W7_9CAEN
MALSWTVAVLVMYTRAALDFPILLAFCPLFRAECRLLVTLIHLHVCTLCHPTVLHKVLPRSVTPDINPKLPASLSGTNGGTAEYSFPAATKLSSSYSSSSSSSCLGNVYKPPPLEPVEEGVEEATQTRDRLFLTFEEQPSSGSSKKGALSASTRKKKKSTIKVLNRFVWDEQFNGRSATPSMTTVMMIAESLDSAPSRQPSFLFTIPHGIAPAFKRKRKVNPTPFISLQTPSPQSSSLEDAPPRKTVRTEEVAGTSTQTDVLIMHEVAKRSSPCLLQRAPSPSATKDLDLPGGTQAQAIVSASLPHTGSGPAAFPSVSSPASTRRAVVPCIAEEETPRGDVSDKSSIRSQGGREKTGED